MNEKQWYITAIMFYYFVVCLAASISYGANYFSSNPATVSVLQQFLCVGMVLASGLYFYLPKVGRRALIVLTIITLIGIGESDSEATLYHLAILLILSIPSLRGKKPLQPKLIRQP